MKKLNPYAAPVANYPVFAPLVTLISEDDDLVAEHAELTEALSRIKIQVEEQTKRLDLKDERGLQVLSTLKTKVELINARLGQIMKRRIEIEMEMRPALSKPISWLREQGQVMQAQQVRALENALTPFFADSQALAGALNFVWPATDQSNFLRELTDIWTAGCQLAVARTLMERVRDIERAKASFADTAKAA